MKLIFTYMGKYKKFVFLAIFIKLVGTMSELLLPYILEHIIDNVVPSGNLTLVAAWGLTMFLAAILTRTLNVMANRRAIENAHHISYDIRQALFEKTVNLTGEQFDAFGLPSLISRMTSDSYNVQGAVQAMQSLCVRAPIMLTGGVIVTLMMDAKLALILICILPVLLCVILFVSSRGIPMYRTVQKALDSVVRIMRENITGIRVVKALSKEDYEMRRFAAANQDMTQKDIKAATIMAIPFPLMQLCLNIGLTLVVIFGAARVNAGEIKPGVILAFLTYFNMITMGVMGINRIFMVLSRASASADRIDAVLASADGHPVRQNGASPLGEGLVRFEDVSFTYGSDSQEKEGFAGEEREKALSHISFSLKKGESLGIIGPTGCGKTTIINLLMYFYDDYEGNIFVDGKDIRTMTKKDLRRRFGTVFQNDMIFMDTLAENIRFGRDLSQEQLDAAARDAMAEEFISQLDAGMEYEAAIKGANQIGRAHV